MQVENCVTVSQSKDLNVQKFKNVHVLSVPQMCLKKITSTAHQSYLQVY